MNQINREYFVTNSYSPMNIAICDDNHAFVRLFRNKIIHYFANVDKECNCFTFFCPEELLHADLSNIHVLFLDIDMPKQNGIDVAKKIRERYTEMFLVFVTAWIEYAPDGYRVNAFRYLLKQRLDDELYFCLDDIREKINQMKECAVLQGRDGPREILLSDVLYFEGTAYRMVRLHMALGKETVIDCKGKLSEYEKEYGAKGFLRVQRSFLINMRHITQIKNYLVHLKNGEAIKASESNYSKISHQFLVWKGKQL